MHLLTDRNLFTHTYAHTHTRTHTHTLSAPSLLGLLLPMLQAHLKTCGTKPMVGTLVHLSVANPKRSTLPDEFWELVIHRCVELYVCVCVVYVQIPERSICICLCTYSCTEISLLFAKLHILLCTTLSPTHVLSNYKFMQG
jgi:hypothetical protein